MEGSTFNRVGLSPLQNPALEEEVVPNQHVAPHDIQQILDLFADAQYLANVQDQRTDDKAFATRICGEKLTIDMILGLPGPDVSVLMNPEFLNGITLGHNEDSDEAAPISSQDTTTISEAEGTLYDKIYKGL